MTHGRSPSRPGSPAGGGQADPGARQRPLAHGRGSTRAVAAISSAPVTIEQVAGDTVGLMEGLGIDLAIVFGSSRVRIIAMNMELNHAGRVSKQVLESYILRLASFHHTLHKFQHLPRTLV